MFLIENELQPIAEDDDHDFVDTEGETSYISYPSSPDIHATEKKSPQSGRLSHHNKSPIPHSTYESYERNASHNINASNNGNTTNDMNKKSNTQDYDYDDCASRDGVSSNASDAMDATPIQMYEDGQNVRLVSVDHPVHTPFGMYDNGALVRQVDARALKQSPRTAWPGGPEMDSLACPTPSQGACYSVENVKTEQTEATRCLRAYACVTT